MTLDVETQLRGYGEQLDASRVPVPTDELLRETVGSGPVTPFQVGVPKLRRLRPWMVAVGAAVLVFIFLGGAALISRTIGGEPQPPVAPNDESLIDIELADIPPFQATYSVSGGPEGSAAATADVAYGGPGGGFRLDAVQGRLYLLGVDGSALPDRPCEGGVSVWDGELIGDYNGCEPEEEFSTRRTSPDFEPLGYLGWQTPWLPDGQSWQSFCASVQSEELPGEIIAGRTAVGIRCVASRDDLELWVDAETGLVLRLAGSRGEGAWPPDFEITAVEYNPAFASDTFRVEPPPGVTDGGLEFDDTEGTGSGQEPDTSGVTGRRSRGGRSGTVDFSGLFSLFDLTEGEIAPPFTGSLLDGTPFDLTDLRGQPVLVMLWADWCPPCTESLGPFQAVADQWAGRVGFVSVLTLDSTPEFASGIVEEQDFTVPVVIDPPDNLWGVLGIPVFVLLDAEGRAIAGWSGSADDQTLDSLLEQFLG